MSFYIFRAGTLLDYSPPLKPRRSTDPVESVSAVHSKLAAYNQGAPKPKQRKAATLVGQIMSTPVTTLPVTAAVRDARALLLKHGFRHLPLVGDSGALAGLVSDRDLLRSEAQGPLLGLARLMTTELVVALPTTSLRQVATVMIEQRVSALPVVNEAKSLVGIVTTADLLRCIVNDEPMDLWA